MSYEKELAAAKKAVSLAACLSQEVQKTLLQSQVWSKSDRSPVTAADYGSQAVVSLVLERELQPEKLSLVAEEETGDLRKKGSEEFLEGITKLVKDTLASEESYAGSPLSTDDVLNAIDCGKSEGGCSGCHWILDPIDGTKGFVKGEQYAVGLALLVEGKVVLGVMACPNLPVASAVCETDKSSPEDVGCLFFATTGSGTYVQPLKGNSPPQKVKVSSNENLEEAKFLESYHKPILIHGTIAKSVEEVSLDNKDVIKKQMTPPPAEEGNNGQKSEDASGETPNEDKKGDGDGSLPKEDESSSRQENQEEEKKEESTTPSGETKSETQGGEDKKDDSKSENGDGGGDSDEKKDLKDNPDEENPDANEKKTKPETEGNESGEDDENQKQFESDNGEKKTSDDDKETKTGNQDTETKTEKENTEPNVDVQVEQEVQPKNETSGDLSPPGAQLELLNETTTQNGSFSTQATESKNEKEAQKASGDKLDYKWALCNTTAGPDYIPCLDNVQAIRSLPSTKHYEHRERHCPDSPPTCLVPLPEGYKRPIEWPKSREKIWYTNVPHTKLAEYKGHQNWVKVTGEYLTFPGGGTQFKHGALHYIDFIQESVPAIAWGNRSRVILDVGCGVASFGGFLFDRDVITMSLAPKDEHEAQVQFALERGIPAISAVMGTTRLPFPGRVFDIVHCARCRVPWHIEGGKLLLELNRVLRPGGFFVWSATPVYQKKTEDVEIWKAMSELIKKMCWELVSINKDTINGVGVATYRKPTSNECYKKRSEPQPPICADSDDPNASWKVPLQACMHTAPEDKTQRGSQWPEQWPARLEKPPFWLSSSQTGVYGKAAPEDFSADYEHWKRVVTKSYLKGLGINWASVRNVMDMRAVYGGFAAALRDLKVWVMNVVPIDSPDTLAIIYERGLFGVYHDWCESFSTYPRSYDLLHADHLFSKLKQRCNLTAVIAEVDRVLRPEGKLIVRDDAETIQEVEAMVKAMKWEVRMTYLKEKEGLLAVQKSLWRPNEVETLTYAIA